MVGQVDNSAQYVNTYNPPARTDQKDQAQRNRNNDQDSDNRQVAAASDNDADNRGGGRGSIVDITV